jgi:hypothetical protein
MWVDVFNVYLIETGELVRQLFRAAGVPGAVPLCRPSYRLRVTLKPHG